MAGRGPAPKQQGRRNRTAPTRGEWFDLPPLQKPVLPKLPPLEGQSWGAATEAMWEAWRKDPATAMWSPADVAFAMDTIMLHQAKAASRANEIRQRMESLGLTPKGRQDRRWRIAEEAPKEEMPRLAEVRRLRAVDTSAS